MTEKNQSVKVICRNQTQRKTAELERKIEKSEQGGFAKDIASLRKQRMNVSFDYGMYIEERYMKTQEVKSREYT